MIRQTLAVLALCLASCGIDGEPEPPEPETDDEAAIESAADAGISG